MSSTATLDDTSTDLTLALAALTPCCDWGHGTDQDDPPCEEPAVWAARIHTRPGAGRCPVVVLLCDPHLIAARTWLQGQWDTARRIPGTHLCANCKAVITDPAQLIWGIERITP